MAKETKKSGYNASSITVLEGLEPVRKRPGMYIGGVGQRGLNHLIYEIVDNAVDEHLAGYCKNIVVTLEKDGSCTVSDDGRGIPVDLHEKGISAERIVLTTLHAGGKFDNSNYKTSGGLHGVGSSVVNALSSSMTVLINRDGKVYKDEFKRGVPRNFAFKDTTMATLCLALKSIGNGHVTHEQEAILKKFLMDYSSKHPIKEDINLMPLWMRTLIKKLLKENTYNF